MALREIRKIGDEILRKKSRPVDKVDARIITLLEDMVETMKHANGVGLAAPQVGILRRIVVVGLEDRIIKLINPEIIESKGSNFDDEGCLSIPNTQGRVERPNMVTVKALNEKGEEVQLKEEGWPARVLCHEIDHLEGILFVDRMEKQ